MSTQQIIQGDCLEVMKTMPDKSFDLVLTDPPYGIDFVPQRGTFEAIANDKQEDAKVLWEAFVPEIERLMKDDSYAFLSIRWTEMDWVLPLLRKHLTVKSCIVWYKNQFGIGYYSRPQHEFNILCLKGKPKPPEVAPSDVWEVAKVHDLKHSCEKPIGLIGKAMSLYSPVGGNVLDCFLGSGTTLVAAKSLDRNAIGIELSPEHCETARRRLGQQILL